MFQNCLFIMAVSFVLACNTQPTTHQQPNPVDPDALSHINAAPTKTSVESAHETCKPYEICNGKDDNCNGLTDEDWPELGQPCTVRFGECTRAGTWACNQYTEESYCTGEDKFPDDDSCMPKPKPKFK